MERDPLALGGAITRLRLRKGLRQADAARKTGIKPGQLSDYEMGKKTPGREVLARIARALDSSIGEIETLAELLGKASDLQSTGMVAQGLRLASFLTRTGEAFLEPFRSRQPDREEHQQPQALLERLLPYSTVEQRALILADASFHSAGFCVLLCQESLDAAADDADRAIERAGLADLVARLVSATSGVRLQGFAAFHLGNAFRVKGNLPRADDQFRRAAVFWERGAAGDPEGRLDEARVLSFEASLRLAQRDLPRALELVNRAINVDRGGTQKGRLLVMRAKVLEEMGQHEEAIDVLHQAATCIDGNREPRVLLNQRFNLLVLQARLGKYQEAERGLPEARDLALKIGERLNILRIRWLEGQIAAGVGRLEEAEAAFEEVRAEFAARGIAFDMALVSLDLAAVYLRQGKNAEVKKLAAEIVEVFRAQRVHREALAAVIVFQKAAERERATVELARRLADYLRRARHDEGAKFGG